jgi:protein CpxP
MTTPSRRLALAAALATLAWGAQAQTPPAPPGAPGPGMQMQHGPFDGQRMHEHMQQRMQERMQRRMEGLKRILQIAPQQEGAFNAWAAAMRPSPAAMQQRQQMHADMARMTTPERIDRMRQMRAQRAAEMDRRAEATKAFYAQLTPPQQKAFDEVSMRFMGHGGKGHHGMHRG